MKKKICLLYANCIPVKGASKSIICDLQRQNYVNIPTDLYDVLIKHKGKSIDEIKKFYKNKFDEIIENYFNILIKNDFAFLTDTPELFPELNLEWQEPFEITNAIIDLDSLSKFSLYEVLKQLSDLNCKFIQIRFYRDTSKKEIDNLFEFLNNIESNSIGFDLLIPYNKDLNDKMCHDLFKKNKRLNNLIIHSSPNGKKIDSMGHSKYYINTGVKITSEKHCGVIDKSMFSINIKAYTESLKFNSCLNRKISIDKKGEIKNCPSMLYSFGNVDSVKLKDVLVDKQFNYYWNLNKDKIKVCQDCEFRYICTDCRAYVENPNDYLSKPLKCGYNPYKGKWENWSESKLKVQTKSYYKI